jgi:hypothetical protein
MRSVPSGAFGSTWSLGTGVANIGRSVSSVIAAWHSRTLRWQRRLPALDISTRAVEAGGATQDCGCECASYTGVRILSGSDAALAAAVVDETDGELGVQNEAVVVVTAYPLPYSIVLTTARKK